MPEQSARLGIPLPLGNENVSRQAIREMLQAVDDHAETIPGAQAKADAAEAAAKAYTDSAAGSAAGAVASALAAHKADFTQQIPYAMTAGSANAYTASTTPALPSLVAGVAITVKFHAANTGASSLNWNGKGAKSIRNPDGTNVGSGDLSSGGVYTLRYDGTNFILQGKGEVKLTGDATDANVLSGKIYYNTDPKTKRIGTMPNNPSQTATLQITGSAKPTKSIPAGYVPPSTITAELATALANKIIAGNTIGGVAGTATISSLGGLRQVSGVTPSFPESYTVSGLALPFQPRIIIYNRYWQAYMGGASSYGYTDYCIFVALSINTLSCLYRVRGDTGTASYYHSTHYLSNITPDGFTYHGPVGSNVKNGGPLNYTLIE
ncbi:hypothetical protein HMPREF0322_04203 [Desulfitobacterium hafniense DP7]|uniref:Uncharacterized protein n=1 Tax=Desulfitobacterium hafniense DP7 TaxID=537010 RepID=G9XT97_DESHA|nr:hypothetical protein [Desulfitobacterium hafniense]EHL05063.1 hypothetical protein HMPREF0322_04203 [Desulfitobacterium hafniense DP7]